jgi:hypothetical protein
MKCTRVSSAILAGVLILALVLAAGCTTPPQPSPAGPAPTNTPTKPGQESAMNPAPSSGLAPSTPASPVSPLATPTGPVSPLATPTALLPATSTPTRASSPTALIAVATRTVAPAQPMPTLPRPTAIAGPTFTRAPTSTPAPTIPPILVTAWVSEANPLPGEDVKVYGRLLVNGKPAAGEGMVARWHLKGGTLIDCVGDTFVDGVAYCTENTYGLPAGFTVRIEVFIRYNQAPYRATTELTIRD